jgi:hypothetical protein
VEQLGLPLLEMTFFVFSFFFFFFFFFAVIYFPLFTFLVTIQLKSPYQHLSDVDVTVFGDCDFPKATVTELSMVLLVV